MHELSEAIKRVFDEHRATTVRRVDVTTTPGGPTDGQLAAWRRLGYVAAQKVMVSDSGYVMLYPHAERFIAVVLARLIRAGIPIKVAAAAARAMWEEPAVTDGELHTYRARIFQGVYVDVIARIDGSGPSKEREQ